MVKKKRNTLKKGFRRVKRDVITIGKGAKKGVKRGGRWVKRKLR